MENWSNPVDRDKLASFLQPCWLIDDILATCKPRTMRRFTIRFTHFPDHQIQSSLRASKKKKGERGSPLLTLIEAELNHSVTCMVLQPTTGMQLVPCYEEFRRPGSDAVEIRWHKKQQIIDATLV
ncbi:hypothetical protein TNCV_4893661 [Trichonephila clavipes]|nr:hypothetical protein TNCV_4893661 [Trichonephila clavipes]